MRSCAKGHYDTAILLCKWNSNALNVKNYRKQTPVAVAIENGYFLNEFIYQRQKIKPKYCLFLCFHLISFSFIDLSDELLQFETNRKSSPLLSSIELNRSLMHSIFKSEKCDSFDDTKRGGWFITKKNSFH